MDLVPEDAGLLVEGRVAPNEVEHLAIGQPVNVRLTAYKAHRVPVITGRLAYVGADRQTDASNQSVLPGPRRDRPRMRCATSPASRCCPECRRTC